ncbi:type II secretion system F family protein [Stackebrandtia nassauensis]|uniref:Type II secretion system protein n=1 Tax=Stackebrandtia nassauensis (strain DSM 44728 / CIP 108903 / NRRL B-16338 / NBRC 102104 / LLR-40K-21) TaxID=446470 RepID=D3PZ69_STANL|nr:hypothetical protein [Stackebrandtia nassauensis]ADD45498.1 hypothetical protein Snas_5869 [Stackebrandtia nassauensis DSM 44728]
MTSAPTRLRRLLGTHPQWPALVQTWRTHLLARLDTAPRKLATALALTAALPTATVAGPTAAAITAIYCAVAILAAARWRAAAATRQHRATARQAVASLAADLRAGANAAPAIAATRTHLAATDDPVCRRIRDRLDATVHITETAGAPTSRLLDQLAEDLRAEARIATTLTTNTAGILASARLLAALPVAGLALGQALGTRPLETLLHTPVGAGCAAVAVTLQLAGLAWSRRILVAATAGETP